MTGAKPCKVCREEKPLTHFPAESKNKDGVSGRCKHCQKSLPSRQSSEKRRAYLADYAAKNAEVLREKAKRYYEANKARIIQTVSVRTKANLAGRRAWAAEYRCKNREALRGYFRGYVARRKVEDSDFRATAAIRLHMNNALEAIKHGRPGSGVPRTLGYSLASLRETVEARFQPGMSWSNHGKWHVDHKIPVLYFVLKGETRPSVIHALCNLQPLWAADNIKKGNTHPLQGTKPCV